MSQVFALADKLDARVLLSGDRYQHGSVERGAALRLLEEEAGLVPAEVKEIQRQSGEYKEAVKALAEGHAAEGFKRLDELGWVREIPDEERYRQLAADYVEAVPGRQDGARRLADACRRGPHHRRNPPSTSRQRASSASDERTFPVLENANLTEAERGDAVNYEPGDVLVFHQNAKGFTRGDRVSAVGDRRSAARPGEAVSGVSMARRWSSRPATWCGSRTTATTADGKHRLNNGSLYRINEFDGDGNIVLDNGWTIGKDLGFLAHGYVVTSPRQPGQDGRPGVRRPVERIVCRLVARAVLRLGLAGEGTRHHLYRRQGSPARCRQPVGRPADGDGIRKRDARAARRAFAGTIPGDGDRTAARAT